MPTEPSYNDIGQLLRKARQEKHMAIEYVAQQLHIRVRYLEALESGKLSELPGLSYAKGYLQVYANFMELDKDELLRRFEDIEEQLGRRGFYFPQVFRKEKTPGVNMVWGGLAGVLLVYLLWMAIQPSRLPVSLVEPFPQEKTDETPPVSGDVSCFNARTALYPPCTMTWRPWTGLVSLQARTEMVMSPADQKTVEK